MENAQDGAQIIELGTSMKGRLLAVMAIAGAAILAFDRSFDSESWILPSLLAAAAPIIMITGTRGLWRRNSVVALVTGLAGVWYLVVTLAPSTTLYGVPTAESLRSLLGSGYQAIATMRTTVVPITPGIGHLALLFGWSWIGGIWSALNIQRGISRVIAPWLVAFVYASLVGMPEGRGVFSMLFLSAMAAALYVWGSAGSRPASSPGLSLRAKAGTWTALSAVVGALVLTPLVPGFGAVPLVELGEPAPGSGGRLAPFSQIRSQLDEERSVVMFTVKSSDPAYWRLTTLEFFDGRTWLPRANYTPSNGEIELAGTSLSVPTKRVDQQYRIRELRGSWLPAAHVPLLVEGHRRVQVDVNRHILKGRELEDGDTFKVISGMPKPTLEQIRSAGAGSAPGLDPFLQIAPGLAFELSRLARQMSEDAQSDYESAVAIQDHLRSFTYSLDVPSRHDARYILRFLTENQIGYCEQFAGAMALLLRSIGIPSRVAVGFLPGSEEDGTLTVTNQEAHAWTEGYFDNIGWLAFEPTPRSEADPPSYTRETPSENSPGSSNSSASDPSPSAAEPGEQIEEQVGGPQDSPNTGPAGIDVSKRAAGIAMGLLVAVTTGLVVVKRSWIAWWTYRARTPSEKVSAAWKLTMIDAELLYRPARRGETQSEYLAGLAARLSLSPSVFEDLKRAELRRAYGSAEIGADESDQTFAAGMKLRKMLWRNTGWWNRARLLAAPSPWLRALRADT